MLDIKKVKFSQDSWNGLIVDGWQDVFSDLQSWLDSPQEIVLDAPCRRVARHISEGGVLYSKLMWARNDGAIQKKEVISWIKWALGPSRAFHIWKVSYAMMYKEHPCAVPILAVCKKCANGRHLNLLVTQEIQAPTIENIILSADSRKAQKAVQLAGICLAKLHKDNFLHGDYLPRNTCLQGEKVIFLDNDKSSHWSFLPPFFLRKRNLDQFAYNLLVLSGLGSYKDALSLAFLNAYCNEANIKDRNELIVSVMEKAKKRWKNKVSRQSSIIVQK